MKYELMYLLCFPAAAAMLVHVAWRFGYESGIINEDTKEPLGCSFCTSMWVVILTTAATFGSHTPLALLLAYVTVVLLEFEYWFLGK